MCIKVVLFGFGNIGKIHYNNLINSEYFQLTNIVERVDISKEIDSSVSYININDKDSLDNIFNNKLIQAIIITSSIDINYTLIKKTLEYNKHIYLENNITQFNYDIEECFRIAQSKNLKLFLGYNRRYDNNLQDIKRRIEEKVGYFILSACTSLNRRTGCVGCCDCRFCKNRQRGRQRNVVLLRNNFTGDCSGEFLDLVMPEALWSVATFARRQWDECNYTHYGISFNMHCNSDDDYRVGATAS